MLRQHLVSWLGRWPSRARIDVVGYDARRRPGWDAKTHALIGVGTPHRLVLSVPPDQVAAIEEVVAHVGTAEDLVGDVRIPTLLGQGDHVVGRGVFRFAADVAPASRMPDVGEWVDRDDPRVPAWLRPFNGGVLIAVDEDGQYGAGVGIKRHDAVGQELSVVTEPALRGRGIGARLVAQAARRVISEGGLPTYLHDKSNEASARLAESVGFRDRGWSVWGLFPR